MRILRATPANKPLGGKTWVYENFEKAIQTYLENCNHKAPCDDVDIQVAKQNNDVSAIIVIDENKIVGYISEVTDIDAEIELTPYGEQLFKDLPKCQLQFVYLIEKGDNPMSDITIYKFNITHDQTTYEEYLSSVEKKISEEE